jgi:CheY-like chemotaxis protein/HPt (histidine-containing phosphotransfer) domain-containing protein
MNPAGIPNFRILLVEDNLTNQEVAVGMLQTFGLSPDVLSNGHEAVQALASGKTFDLIFMDVQMPVMDGIEATRQIRALRLAAASPDNVSVSEDLESRQRRTPIIAMTAHALASDRARCLAAGMNDYITKPLLLSALQSMLHKWLPAQEGSSWQAAESGGSSDPQPAVDASFPMIFNRKALMERLRNDERLARKIKDVFLNDMTRQLQLLKDTVAQGNVTQALSLAHKIKGAAANIGGEAMSRTAAAMETDGAAAGRQWMETQTSQLEQQFQMLARAMDSP